MSNVQTIENMTVKELKAHVEQTNSISALLEALGINARHPKARKLLNERLNTNGLTFKQQRSYKDYTVEDIEKAAKTAQCYADVLTKIGLDQHGGNLRTIKKIIEKHNIDVSHFNVGEARKRNKRQWTFEEIFCEGSTYHRSNLAQAVQKFGLLDYKCAQCNNTGTWNGSPLDLDIDHINGISNDNRPNNLRYLCPNCHRQTKTWGRKKG